MAPIETNALFWRLAPCKMTLGPTNTWLPIFTFLEIWTLSWITELLPILIPSFPKRVALYQIDDLSPTLTFPKTVALGAIKSVYYICGLLPLYERFLKLGTILSSEPNSPSSLVPTSYNLRPTFLNNGPVNFYCTFTIIS